MSGTCLACSHSHSLSPLSRPPASTCVPAHLLLLLLLSLCLLNHGLIAAPGTEIPQFWQLPEPEIYEDEAIKEVSIQVVVSPVNTTVMLAYMSLGSGGYSDEMKMLTFGTSASFLSSDEVGVVLEGKELIGQAKSQERWRLKIVRCALIFDKSLHILVKNALGTVTSRPFKIIRKVLNPFPLVHHESAEFLMGNVGQIICMLPHSKPSPPSIEFLHDNIPINTTNGSKFKKVYLHPGAMILLIRNLMPQDEGSYTCTASFPGTKSFQKSDKKTRLSVFVPKEKLKPRFRLSSHDNERKGDKVIEVLEGSNITMYCLYESAPVAEVAWYWQNSHRKYEVDPHFGTLSITNVQTEDASKFSCLTNDGDAQSFGMKVISLPRFTSTPSEIAYSQHARSATEITCEVQNGGGGHGGGGGGNGGQNGNIKWFHDGQILTDKQDEFKFLKNVLFIKALQERHLGVYQCWLENDGSLWAAGLTLVSKSKEFREADLHRENASVIDKRTAAGFTIHLECSLLESQRDALTDSSVKWLRYRESLEPIELSNKYVMFTKKSERKFILSIVNPTRNQDEGMYICQLYDQFSRLLHTVRYVLTIDDQKPSEPSQFLLKSTELAANKNQKALVSDPEAVRLNEYVFAVSLKWSVLPEATENLIDHFKVEYQKKITDRSQQKDAIANNDKKSDEWSEVAMIDDFPTANHITITDTLILQSGLSYRFRVIIILKVLSSISSSEVFNRTFFESLRSGWSNVVDFGNILNCKLTVSNKPVASSAVQVMWTHNCVRDMHWQQILFYIVYASIRDCSRARGCQLDKHAKNDDSILIFPEFQPLRVVIEIKGDFGEFFQANLTNLDSDNEYVVALYGKQITTSQEVFYIPLSNVIKVSTSKMMKPGTLETPNQHGNLSESDDARNRVIFLILGSLTGVLFVVAAVMFGMCTWYYMKKHMKIHKVHMKPSDASQPAFLLHYPPSSMSSPLCYGSRINPLSPYQQSLSSSTNNKLIYYPNQTVGKSPLNSCGGQNQQSDLWPLNYYSHSPNTLIMADKFSSDRDSDIESICNSDRNVGSNVRRPIVMGVDQASSTYSRIGSERRFSIGALNLPPNEYPSNFQNMTLPRQSIVPIVFPQPPADPTPPDKYSGTQYDISNQHAADSIDEASASLPFLDVGLALGPDVPERTRAARDGLDLAFQKSSSWRKSSMHSLMQKKDYMEVSNEKISPDNPWATDTYYDPYSSNSSVGNETSQLKSMIPAYP